MSAPQILAPPLPQQSSQPPTGPWRWAQTWRELFFAHWQVSPEAVRRHLPTGLDVDTRDGMAWISVVAFRLDVRHRWLPSFGMADNFVEINLRTYVRFRDEPGIYFLSIHAGRRMAVALARWLTPLPYVYAPIVYGSLGDVWQLECGGEGALLKGEFSPSEQATVLAADSLDDWLLERYRGFVADGRGRIQRMVAQHPPWAAQHATGWVQARDLGAPWGLDLGWQPNEMHFATRMQAEIWPFETM